MLIYLCSTYLTMCLIAPRRSDIEEPGQTTASHMLPSWNRRNSDFSPQNFLNAAA